MSPALLTHWHKDNTHELGEWTHDEVRRKIAVCLRCTVRSKRRDLKLSFIHISIEKERRDSTHESTSESKEMEGLSNKKYAKLGRKRVSFKWERVLRTRRGWSKSAQREGRDRRGKGGSQSIEHMHRRLKRIFSWLGASSVISNTLTLKITRWWRKMMINRTKILGEIKCSYPWTDNRRRRKDKWVKEVIKMVMIIKGGGRWWGEFPPNQRRWNNG